MALYESTTGEEADALYNEAKTKVLGNAYTTPTIFANRITISQGGYFVDNKECFVYIKGKFIYNPPKGQTAGWPNISTCLITSGMPNVWQYLATSDTLLATDLKIKPYIEGAIIEAQRTNAGQTGLGFMVRPKPGYNFTTVIPYNFDFEIYGKYFLA